MRFLVQKQTGVTIPQQDLMAYAEQIVYRSVKCRPCYLNGNCFECGCQTPASFFDKDNWCEIDNWNEMLSTEDWELYKKDTGFNFKISYQDERDETNI